MDAVRSVCYASASMGAEPRELNQPSPDDTSARPVTRSLAHPRSWPAYAQGAGVVGFCTILAWDMASYFTLSNLLMIYLIGTVGVANWAPAAGASGLRLVSGAFAAARGTIKSFGETQSVP